MNEAEALSRMKSPNMRRNCWRGGIIQIMITRACTLACPHCTAHSQLGGKMMMMSPDQFRLACDSLSNYWGVRAVFGGNPPTHPKFDEICEIVKEKIPFENSGIWTNDPCGKAHLMQGLFAPYQSNINCHQVRRAYDEFAEGWPDSIPYLKGLDPEWPEAKAIRDPEERKRRVGDSRHSPPLVAPCDLGYTEEEMWDLASKCFVGQEWSALIGVYKGRVKAWWCEEAAHQSMMHELNPDWRGTGQPMPDTGIDVEQCVQNGDEWWNHDMGHYAAQVREHCRACGMCLNGYGALACGDNFDMYSKTHEFIMKPKRKDRALVLVTDREQLKPGSIHATKYIQNAALPIIG